MLPPMNPLADLESTEVKTLTLARAAQLIEFKNIHDAINEMHRRVTQNRSSKESH